MLQELGGEGEERELGREGGGVGRSGAAAYPQRFSTLTHSDDTLPLEGGAEDNQV